MRPEQIPYFLFAIPFLPLAAAVANTALWGYSGRSVRLRHFAIAITLVAFLGSGISYAAVSLLHHPLNGEGTATILPLWGWIKINQPLKLYWALRFDALANLMLPVVLLIGILVAIFSIGYLHDRKHDQVRYFAWLCFFLFSMLLLVVAGNLLVFFVAWEAVGLASYKLISFYVEKEIAQRSGIKAFVVNRIGDAALLLAMFAIFHLTGSADFRDLGLAFQPGGSAERHANFVALMALLAAAAKSAQIPLYVWLPDAMTGPTPISALIHAATMVTAGIFLMLRLEPVFILAPQASALTAWTGALTALLAAFIAAGQTDIKKVLAFSTVSQLGLMVAAVGCGSYAAAFFHLFTHAFFKAMLFLCAGAVITYLHHEQNIRHMGGLLREFPLLGFLFWIAIAALAGIPGFSGFFSKDHILAAAFSANFGGMFLGSILLVVSLLTAFYSFRLGIIVLHGKPAHAIGHGEELPRVSFYLPLVALAIPSLFAGFAALPALFTGNQPYFFEYLERNFPLYSSQLVSVLQHKHGHEQELMVVIAGVAAALVGAIAAIIYYGILKNRPVAEGAYRSLLARLALAKAYVDELYDFVFVQPYRRWAQRLASAEENLTPRVAEGVAGFAAQVARFTATLQTGVLAHYALSIFIGIVLLLALMLGVL